MITKIQATDFKHTNNNYDCSGPKPKQNMAFSNTLPSTSFNPEMLQNYFVSFTGEAKKTKKTSDSRGLEKTNGAEYIHKSALQLAKELNHKEAGPWHVIYNALADDIQFIDELGV